MIKITYLCDHCKKEITMDECGEYSGLVDVDFEFPTTSFHNISLCVDCYNELMSSIDEFIVGAWER